MWKKLIQCGIFHSESVFDSHIPAGTGQHSAPLQALYSDSSTTTTKIKNHKYKSLNINMGTIILPLHIYCHTVAANNIGEKHFKCKKFVHYVHPKIDFLKK